MSKSKLAIIIPAYKIDFFRETLESLASQTCKDFTVYIGDDSSPDNFKSIVSEYIDRIDIVYHRFPENLGGRDLVGQWERCVGLTQGEPWIWLFSDDDIMGSRCVELFLREVNGSHFDLYHFNVDVISSASKLLYSYREYPPIISSEDFYKGKASARLGSFVVEYVFSRAIYEKTGGFVNFDMAWGSDIATWVRMGYDNGIVTIPEAKVLWRLSDKNITPNLNNQMVFRKAKIEVEFIDWINKFFKKSSIRRFNKYAFFRMIFYYARVLTRAQNKQVLKYAKEQEVVGSLFVSLINCLYPLIKVIKELKG